METPRQIPPQTLTPRNNFVFPKGTIFSFEEGPIDKFIEQRGITGIGIDEKIAKVTIDNKTHVFCGLDLSLVFPKLDDEFWQEMEKDQDHTLIKLAVFMYANRFPYEE